MDDEEIDAVDIEMDELGVGKRKTFAGKGSVVDRKNTANQSRQGTIYGQSKTSHDFIERF